MECLLADNTPACTECRLECQENWDHGRQNLINKQTNNQIRIRKRFVMFESLKTKATEGSSGEKEFNISTPIFFHKCAVVQFYPQLKFNIRRLSPTPPPPPHPHLQEKQRHDINSIFQYSFYQHTNIVQPLLVTQKTACLLVKDSYESAITCQSWEIWR